MAAGRPRTFDIDEALEKVMRIYWKNGYSNTSLGNIIETLGVTKPSLYAAFGNKEQLFIAALGHYLQTYLQPNFEHLTHSTNSLEDRLRNCLRSIASLFSPPNAPGGGCLFAHSLCEFTADGMPEGAKMLLTELNHQQEEMLINFFADEIAKGNLKSDSPPRTVALFFMSVNGGIAALARCGTSLEDLNQMIDHGVKRLV